MDTKNRRSSSLPTPRSGVSRRPLPIIWIVASLMLVGIIGAQNSTTVQILSSSGSQVGNFMISPNNITTGFRLNMTANILVGPQAPYTYNFLVISGPDELAFMQNITTSNLTQSAYYKTQGQGTFYANVTIWNASNSLIGNSTRLYFNVTTLTYRTPPGNWLNEAGRPNIEQGADNFSITNVTQDSVFYVQFGSQDYIVTDNYIAPNYTGLTVDNQSYYAVNSTPVFIGQEAGLPIYMVVQNITWYLQPYLSMEIYQSPTPFTTTTISIPSTTLPPANAINSTISFNTTGATTSTSASTSTSLSSSTTTTISAKPSSSSDYSWVWWVVGLVIVLALLAYLAYRKIFLV